MPGFLVHAGASLLCPHGGPVTAIASNARVRVGGQPVVTMADTYLAAGCAFVVAGVPQPCLRVQWMVPAMRVRVGGQPPIIQGSVGLALSAAGAPQGPPTIVSTQFRVKAT